MKITIFGTGYVGLVQGACMADLGHDVLCIDIDAEKIKKLNKGQIPFYEPGLSDLITRNTKQGRLQFSLDANKGIEFAQTIFIAVGTPQTTTDKQSPSGQADLSAVFTVAKVIGENMKEYKVIVNKSTVPPLTTQKVRRVIQENLNQKELKFSIVSNPEFLKEGSAVKDFLIPDRIVAGIEKDDKQAKKIMLKIYDSLVRADKPIMFTDTTTSETIKYAANAMLASKISFMNELSHYAEKTGANIKEIARGIGLDNRIGPRFLQAGCGYGGACFPKDIQSLIYEMKENNVDCEIMSAIESVNLRQKQSIIKKVNQIFPDLEGKKIGIWGLSFKPNTDDIREAPSKIIIKDLLEQGAEIKTFDPEAMDNFKTEFLTDPDFNGGADIVYCQNPYEVAKNIDLLILVTEWNAFKEIDMEKIKNSMQEANLIDCRNVYKPQEIKELGFNYVSIGRE
ncbi:UDP-glucose/GDP-mannose dehydrogenase family protein [bacterium]|nr:UDP-glucose/GDP-mannose dehydrogenase family protein [bacterium]